MSLEAIDTTIELPPGLLSQEIVRELLRLVFEEFRWFQPVRCQCLGPDKRLVPGESVVEQVMAHREEGVSFSVLSRAEVHFISVAPSKVDAQYPYTGSVSWITLGRSASKPEWRGAHEVQIKHLMTLLRSPLAYTALSDDIHAKTRYLVPREWHLSQEITVRDYSEGLAGLYWRNFFGPPFVRMFGDRLQALPPECRKDLGDGIVLVQPYPLPGDAETEKGKARERELIQLLGPECFYDHEHHVLPSKRPDLSAGFDPPR